MTEAAPKIYQDSLEPLLLSGLVEEAVQADSSRWQKERLDQSKTVGEALHRLYGPDVELPTYMSPSIAAMCVRWAAYASYSGVEPLPSTFKQNMAMTIGTAVHWSLLKKMNPFGLQELAMRMEDPFLSGRLDFLFRNPLTQKWQVLDFKVVGDFTFREVRRTGLPDYLKENKKVYKAKPEAELQTLLYLWMARRQGYEVGAGNVIYINRRDSDFKECLIVWDAVGEQKVNAFLKLLREAQKKAQGEELPPPSIVSGGEYLCSHVCSFRHVCEPGRNIAKGKVDLKRRRSMTRSAKFLAKKAAKERKLQMEKSGRLQPRLFED